MNTRQAFCVYCVGLLMLVGVLSGVNVNSGETHEFTSQQRSYWAFQPVEDPVVPQSSEANPIDAFVSEQLRKHGLERGDPADKVTLIRRATLDLLGLPPTPRQLQDFLEDDSPAAYEKLVDRLLSSPHYGERWARHWLDLARFAESEGFKSDETRPNAWRYRDYVIDALNADKPYDRFVQEQIAGDELWPHSTEARIATGFNRHHPDESNAAILMQRRQEVLLDITDTVGAVFMGITYGCAKCHDHKFDPILQKDYYRLQAFFTNIAADNEIVLLSEAELAEHERKQAIWEEATKAIRKSMDELIAERRNEVIDEQINRRAPQIQTAFRKPETERTMYEKILYQKHMWQLRYQSDEKLANAMKGEPKERYEQLQEQLAEFDHLKPVELPRGMGIRELGSAAPSTFILSLANYANPQEEVQPGFPTILAPDPAEYSPVLDGQSSGRRSALAHWLTDPQNPLTTRVIVNRIWHYHFGSGIVGTPSDFGMMGARPTHPQLLDWLASEFVNQGWSLKKMHRLMMTSETYKQSTAHRADAAEVDPENEWLWRYPTQRHSGEVIRDSMLAVSGRLNLQTHGPSVYPELPLGAAKPRGGWLTEEQPGAQDRRSVYVFVRRNARYPMLESFDMPDTHESCAQRNTTTTAPQALELLNNGHALAWAQGLAGRVLEEAGADRQKQIEAGFQLAYSRSPDSWEKDTVLTFFDTQRQVVAERVVAGEPLLEPDMFPESMSREEVAVVVDFCHMLLNSNEFVYQN